MTTRLHLLPLLIVLATLSCAGAVAAEPPRIDHLASRSVPLTVQERGQIEQYSRHWIDVLSTGDPESVYEAGRRMRAPLTQLGVTAIFRDEYSRAAMPLFEQLLADQSTSNFVAVNAMQIAALFGTESAMRLMVNRSDPEAEQRKAVRIWAAQGFQALAESGHIRDRQLTNFLRDLLRAAQQETDWHVLLRQFEAMSVVPDSMPQQLTLLTAVVNRIEKNNGANPAMQSVQRGVSLLLHQFIQLPVSEQREFGIAAGPTLGKVLQAAEKHWEPGQDDETAKMWYQRAVASTETLLRAVDAAVRSTTPPSTNLDQHWERGNREQFKSDMQQWLRVLERAPYKQ